MRKNGDRKRHKERYSQRFCDSVDGKMAARKYQRCLKIKAREVGIYVGNVRRTVRK